jgi:hypothetical protein
MSAFVGPRLLALARPRALPTVVAFSRRPADLVARGGRLPCPGRRTPKRGTQGVTRAEATVDESASDWLSVSLDMTDYGAADCGEITYDWAHDFTIVAPHTRSVAGV